MRRRSRYFSAQLLLAQLYVRGAQLQARPVRSCPRKTAGRRRRRRAPAWRRPSRESNRTPPEARAADHMRASRVDGRPCGRGSACGAKGAAPRVGATEMSASAGSAGVLLGSRGRGAPPTEARRHTWRQAPTPPATGRRSLFIFRGAGPGPTGSTAAPPPRQAPARAGCPRIA